MALGNGPVVLTITEKLQGKMYLCEPQIKNSVKNASADVWGYVKSRGEKYAHQVVQQDVTSGEKLAFSEISKNVESFAAVLRSLDLSSGIGICSENNLQYCWILLGALRAGAKCILLSPTYTSRELRHFLELAKPDVVLCSKQVSEKFYENEKSFGDICSEYSFLKHVYVWGLESETCCENSYESFFSLFTSCDLDERSFATPGSRNYLSDERDFDDAREALVLASSGSTGLPKGVVLTHRAVIESLKLSSVYAGAGETALGLMPFFHAYGLILSLMCLCEGSRLMIVPKLVGAKYLSDVIDAHQINNLYLVPSLLATIGKCPTFTREKLSCVKHVWTSAGRVSRRVQERAMDLIPKEAVLHHCYGMTETTFVTITGPYEKAESPGKVVSNIECKIISEFDEICGPDEVGELCFKGPTVMKGYLDNEKATKEVLDADGWLKSGDLGFRDQDGFFFIVDRIKEMIKYQGNQISPVEIEEIILELPDVLEATVFGVPSDDLGELPAAGVVVRQNSKLTTEEVKEYIAKQLSPYKQLRGGVFFLDKLQRTGTGKVQRKALLDVVKNAVNSSPQDR